MMFHHGGMEYNGRTRSRVIFLKLAILVFFVSNYYINYAQAIHNDLFDEQFQAHYVESLDSSPSRYGIHIRRLLKDNNTSIHKHHGDDDSKNNTSTHKNHKHHKDHFKKLYVDKSGDGNTTSIQKAVHMVKSSNTHHVTIYIAAGKYHEQVTVPKSKTYITFVGVGMNDSIITYGTKTNDTDASYSMDMAALIVKGDHFVAHNISFHNTSPKLEFNSKGVKLNKTTVALKVSGDYSAFFNCGMYGYQNTLHDDKGRHFFKNCYIEGAIDFIIGNGRSLYQGCTIKSIAKRSGSITAHLRKDHHNNTGFAFVQSNIIGSGVNMLGRAGHPFARVVIASSNIEDIIDPAGWDSFGKNKTIFFGEYNNKGKGAKMDGRVSYTKVLTKDEAKKFIDPIWISSAKDDGWIHGI